MKKVFVLFFTSLLITSMMIGCGSSSSSDDKTSKVNVPGGGLLSTETKKPDGNTPVIKTGLTSTTGCKDTNGGLPGCAK